jgi:hypothetical protein
MTPSISSPQDESNSASQVRRSPKGGLTFRIRGIPLSWDKEQLQVYLEQEELDSQPLVKSLACEVDGCSKTATVLFQSSLPAEKTSKPWNISLPEPDNDHDDFSVSALPLRVDGAFLGITTLFTPPVEDHGVE